MRSQGWENLNEDIESDTSFSINEVIDLLRQAIETSDMLFVERALSVLENNDEYDEQFTQGYNQLVGGTE